MPVETEAEAEARGGRRRKKGRDHERTKKQSLLACVRAWKWKNMSFDLRSLQK
jgi:hypothetical protein